MHKYAYNIHIAVSESLIIGKFWESVVVLKNRLMYKVHFLSNKKDCFTALFIQSSFHHIYTALKHYIYSCQKHNIHHTQT
jgi:hypothetical protein